VPDVAVNATGPEHSAKSSGSEPSEQWMLLLSPDRRATVRGSPKDGRQKRDFIRRTANLNAGGLKPGPGRLGTRSSETPECTRAADP
jgi:hypothetical protein